MVIACKTRETPYDIVHVIVLFLAFADKILGSCAKDTCFYQWPVTIK